MGMVLIATASGQLLTDCEQYEKKGEEVMFRFSPHQEFSQVRPRYSGEGGRAVLTAAQWWGTVVC
jgi:hypothetical protein